MGMIREKLRFKEHEFHVSRYFNSDMLLVCL